MPPSTKPRYGPESATPGAKASADEIDKNLRLISSLPQGAVFEPEVVAILEAAFERAWSAVVSSGASHAEKEHAKSAREILAADIIHLASHGELDPIKLADGALLTLSRSKINSSTNNFHGL